MAQSFSFFKVRDLPAWVEDLDRELIDLIAQPFRQCAVAIGGAAPSLPVEIEDLRAPITPLGGGKWELEKFQSQGN